MHNVQVKDVGTLNQQLCDLLKINLTPGSVTGFDLVVRPHKLPRLVVHHDVIDLGVTSRFTAEFHLTPVTT